MTAGVETLAIEDFLHDTLTTATGLPAWEGVVPEDAPYPCILFAFLDAGDMVGLGPNRIAIDATYAVRVYGETESFTTLRPYAVQMDAALTGQQFVVKADGTVLLCRRQSPLVSKEVYDGVTYSALGGVYRLIAQ